MTALTINVDFDGVICDFRKDAEEMLFGRGCYLPFRKTDRPEIPEWQFYKHWVGPEGEPITGKMFWKMVNDNLLAHPNWLEQGPRIYGTGVEMPGASAAIKQLHDAGHRIQIVTSKAVEVEARAEATRRTMLALERLGIPFESIVFIVKNTANKTRYPADVVIDDNPDWRDWYQEDACNIMFAQPWNTHDQLVQFYEPMPPLMWRVGWDQVPEIVQLWADVVGAEAEPDTNIINPYDLDEFDESLDIEPARAHAEEAIRLVYGDRQADYGHPYDDYSRTVGAFNALTGHDLSVLDGGLFMVLVKLSRQMNKPKADNMVDAHGYLMVMDRILEREQNVWPPPPAEVAKDGTNG